MHLHFERIEKPNSYSDCNILSLSWMGKVPDGLLQTHDEEGWKLNRTNYYQDGWIALGNGRGIVGVTYTTCRCRKTDPSELPSRTNYNLRGHRSEVTLVKWNEPYQKLASCDSSGIIFVWIKYEGRWSVELINDRSTQVTDFSWSHDGRMALICYVDGFVLIGSVAGQRYWSSMLNLDSCSTTCGIWTPDDHHVIFGTSNGSILVIDINGTIVAQTSVRDGHNIRSMAWSSEKFKMEDSEDDGSSNFNSGNRSHILSICFDDGVLYLLRNYDDILPIIIRTNLIALKMEWSNKGEVLAVGGHQIVQPVNRSSQKNQFSSQHHHQQQQQTDSSPSSLCYMNQIHFYTESGCLRYKVTLDYTHHPICSLTWGHNDKRLFVGTGPVLHIAWITKRIASLQLLCRLTIQKKLAIEHNAFQLPVPNSLQNLVASLFGRTLRCYLPDSTNLTKFVVNPPVGNTRLYCTLIRHDNDNIVGESSSSSYVLYLEYLGGLVPILKGKRTSKLRPEFVIYDPELKNVHLEDYPSNSSIRNSPAGSCSNKLPSSSYYWNSSSTPGTSDSESEDAVNNNSSNYHHTAMRIRRRRRSRRNREREANNNMEANVFNGQLITNFKPESTYSDEMPESQRLTLITSNIWGTKFKVLGLVPWLPACLGSIAYRTSLLHLQPRQMTLKIKELGGPRRLSESENISSYVNRNGMMMATTSSEDEDESATNDSYRDESYCVPIAPMTPRRTFRYHYPLNSASQSENISNQSATSSASSSYFFHNNNNISNNNNPIQYHNQLESNHHLHDHAYNLNSSSTQFHSGLIDSNGQDYINLISHLNEDLLTLQLSTTESSNQLISMELTSVEQNGSEDIDQNVDNTADFSTTPKAPASSSVSTQTSFQSLSDLRDIKNQSKEGAQDNQTNGRPSIAESSQLLVPISFDQLKTETPKSSKWSDNGLTSSQSKLSTEDHITNNSYQPSLINTKSEIISSFNPLSTSIDNNNQLPSSISIDSGTCRSGINLSPFGREYTSPSLRNHRNQRSLREKRTDSEIKPIKTFCYGSLERSLTVNGSIRTPPSLKLCDQNRRSFRSSHQRSPMSVNSMVTSPTSVHRNQSTTSTSSVPQQHPACSSTSSSFSTLPLQYSPGFSTASAAPLLSNGQLDGLSSNPCSVYSVAKFQPLSTPNGQHDIKYIDEQEMDDGLSNDPNLVVGRSPSFLFCRNRSSIAQYHHRSSHPHNSTNNIDHNSSYGSSSAIDFTGLRANIETQNFVQPTCHQRRYTLSTSRSSGGNSIAGRTTPDHHLPGSGHSTLTRNGKEIHRNCMSLDEDEDEDESEESGRGVASSSTFCKCDEETESSSSMSENCTSKSFLDTDRCSDRRKRDDPGSCGSDYDVNQRLMASSTIQNRQKLLSFDCDEILNSLNEGNHLLRDNSLVITQPPPSIGSVFSRSSSRIVNSESGNYIGQHRGSLGLPVMGSDAINLAKNFRNDFVNRSLPASPLSEKKNKRKAEGKSIFYSPTMFRKAMKQKLNYFDCSSDDDNGSEDDLWSNDFKNLGSFQRSTIRRHIKVKRRSSRIQPDSHNMNHSRHHAGREFLLHNKAPLWNEVNQVYQLDFGGRVTQESAKNFQIEHQGKQVMQFGRIDDNAYTLDFQYPFSALQALGVALANVTQRLK
ncbi:WD40 superfamily protein Tusp [Brevipalpus obovatus]|uniref:WD40 superfamily protein Tusp n=1 Tax=Brevipalpus obovatus TaxID=246614 RepID=UPI003D9F7A8C